MHITPSTRPVTLLPNQWKDLCGLKKKIFSWIVHLFLLLSDKKLMNIHLCEVTVTSVGVNPQRTNPPPQQSRLLCHLIHVCAIVFFFKKIFSNINELQLFSQRHSKTSSDKLSVRAEQVWETFISASTLVTIIIIKQRKCNQLLAK